MSDPLDEPWYGQALRWLAQRAYGERELAERLLRAGADADCVERVLTRCRALGYLNDWEFVRARIRVRRARGWGEVRIRAELRSLGVDAELMVELLDQVDEEQPDPVERARAVLNKRFGAEWNREDFRERGRRYAFLARRGFEADVIAAALA
ncbi:MAG: regulatory protein RecX [Magnetococcales bacterium]|nr:regulatory protein RecX [Magnetococcales bacterium]